jgi:hypothetical protein
MQMNKCPECGELYSASYKKCPFCEEEAAYEAGNWHKKDGDKRRRKSGRGRYLLIATLVLCLFVVGRSLSKPSQTETETANEGNTVEETVSPIESNEGDPVEVDAPETAVTLDREDVTFRKGDDPLVLVGTGGSGSYQWTSSDSEVATVGEDGSIQAVGDGSCTVSCTDGYTTASCIVRIKGFDDTDETQVSVENAELNRTDMTLKRGESFRLKVTGTTASVSWSGGSSSVATVSEDGTVKGIGQGKTEVTATVGDRTLTCVVRVK